MRIIIVEIVGKKNKRKEINDFQRMNLREKKSMNLKGKER